MKALCLGFSSVVRRRVLPALERLEGIEMVEIASRRGAPPADQVPSKLSRAYDSFGEALRQSGADWVYVSTVNSEHSIWARKALEAGFHVVVDKPAFLRLDEAEELNGYARGRGLVLAESTVYLSHPQVGLCREVLAEADSSPQRLTAHFSMPPLDAANFRYRRALGGGALYDLGPYAMSVGRAFFGATFEEVSCVLCSRGGPDAVETAFSMLARYSEGRTVIGHFGFDTEYRNEITVLGDRLALSVQRFFTTPENLESEIRIHHQNKSSIRRAPAADSFACFLSSFSRACQRPDGSTARQLSDDLLTDARALRALQDAAEKQPL